MIRRRPVRKLWWGLATCLLLAPAAGCGDTEVPAERRVIGGDAATGREVIARYGCGTCHRVPGLREARGMVGPPLDGFGRRSFLAGEFPNRPQYLTLWLQDPPSMAPGTAMPNLGVSVEDARHMAAYLYTLR